jgi:hypothetical protein
MKKNILTLALLIVVNLTFGQWKTELIDNQLDAPTKTAYCNEQNGSSVLKLININNQIVLMLTGLEVCKVEYIDVALVVNGISKKYMLITFRKINQSGLLLDDNILVYSEAEKLNEDVGRINVMSPFYNSTSSLTNFLSDFKSCTKMIIRPRQSQSPCASSIIYNFIMTGSTKAINFVIGTQ